VAGPYNVSEGQLLNGAHPSRGGDCVWKLISAVVVKFYLGDDKKFDDLFWKLRFFDDPFSDGNHISHKFPS
jgi:hypothetical protein